MSMKMAIFKMEMHARKSAKFQVRLALSILRRALLQFRKFRIFEIMNSQIASRHPEMSEGILIVPGNREECSLMARRIEIS